jgi:hypothetical protein
MPRDCCTAHLVEDCTAFLLTLKKAKRLNKAQQRQSDALVEAMMLKLGELVQEETADA